MRSAGKDLHQPQSKIKKRIKEETRYAKKGRKVGKKKGGTVRRRHGGTLLVASGYDKKGRV